MGAAAEQHRALSIGMIEVSVLRPFLRFQTTIAPVRIVFDTSNRSNPVARNPDRRPSVDIFRLLCADQIQQPKCRRHKKSEPSKPALRSRRQARIHQYGWNSALVRECYKYPIFG